MIDSSILRNLENWLKMPHTWLLGLVVLGNVIFGRFPVLTESFYANGIFQIIRMCYDHTIGLLPFPMVYLLFLLLVLSFLYFIRHSFLHIRDGWSYWKSLFVGGYKWISVVLFLFYFLWGFNYQRLPFSEKLKLNKTAVDRTYLLHELSHIKLTMDSLRHQFVGEGATISDQLLRTDLEDHIRSIQVDLFADWDLKTSGRVRIRKLEPEGVLLRISTAGVYIPFAIEGHIDGGLHPIQWPATMAHEMAHGYGRTDEGVCNFIGFVTCLASDDPVVAYSGWMMYLRYVLHTLRKLDRDGYQELVNALPHDVLQDIRDIQKQLAKFPDIFPAARDVIYDQYLKSHGVKEGLVSYSTIVQMVADWKMSPYNTQLHW